MSALPIVPLADLVAELRKLHHIPCLAAADRLEECQEALMARVAISADLVQAFDALRPLCPTCNGSRMVPEPANFWGSGPCPDCVDGHVTWQRLVNVFNAVWKWERGTEKNLGRDELWMLYGQWELLDHLRTVR